MDLLKVCKAQQSPFFSLFLPLGDGKLPIYGISRSAALTNDYPGNFSRSRPVAFFLECLRGNGSSQAQITYSVETRDFALSTESGSHGL